MNSKMLGVLPIILMLCFTVFLAIGDNPATAAPQDTQTQTAQVTIGDVISIVVPSVISNAHTGVDSVASLQLLNGNATGTVNTVQSLSNGRIDVFMKSNSGPNIYNNNATLTYPDTLTNFRYTNALATPATVNFATTYAEAIDDWKVSQNTVAGTGDTKNIPVFVTVPTYTAEGDYVAIVSYAAVRHDQTPS